MKLKLALAALVIGGFIAYSLHAKQSNSSTSLNSSLVPAPTPTTASGSSAGKYKDGTYTGSVADAFYGNIQVKATIAGGKITDVQFLQYPNDQPHSIEVSQASMPQLRQEALQSQSAQVDTVSGATDTSQAFVKSLSAALASAQS